MIEKDRQDENPIGLCPCKLMLCSVFALLPYPHKAQCLRGSLSGGEGEIRTLETLLGFTRFPVVRPRPG